MNINSIPMAWHSFANNEKRRTETPTACQLRLQIASADMFVYLGVTWLAMVAACEESSVVYILQ